MNIAAAAAGKISGQEGRTTVNGKEKEAAPVRQPPLYRFQELYVTDT
jgi:hypothetical protein